jgi:hypothetical protein
MAQEEPNELSPVEKLLRLKRYEQPEEGFVEDFLTAFHQRQRQEMLKNSARGLLWERVTAYWYDLITPRRVAGLTAAAAVLLVLAWVAMPSQQTDNMAVRFDDLGKAGEAAMLTQFGVDGVLLGVEEEKPVVESSLLLSDHFSGGFADEARVARVSRAQQAVGGRESSVR